MPAVGPAARPTVYLLSLSNLSSCAALSTDLKHAVGLTDASSKSVHYRPCSRDLLDCGAFCHYSVPDRGAEYCDDSMSLCACVCVLDHIFRTTCPILHQFLYRLAIWNESVPKIIIINTINLFLNYNPYFGNFTP